MVTRSSLLVVGGASLDTLVVGDAPVASPGGAGLYTALAAARAGAVVTMLAPRPDPMPEVLAPALDHLRWVGPSVPPDQLPRFEIAYHPDGSVRHFDVFTGAEPDMTPSLLDDLDEVPGTAYCVPFLDAELQHAFVTALADLGCRTVASTYGVGVREHTDVVRATIERADWFFCNEDEATVLFGRADAATTAPGRLLFVTLGRHGARVHQGDHATTVAGHTVDAIDPTGAGDTFCGTTVARLLVGDHPVTAAEAGVRAAAHEVTGVGPARLLGAAVPVDAVAADDVEVATVDRDRVAAVASLIADLDDLTGFDFVGELFPDAADPGALDLFFAATLCQFGFWHDDGARWTAPVFALVDGRRLKGSDHVWDGFTRWLVDDPNGLTPAALAEVTDAEFAQRLADDQGRVQLPGPGVYAGLLRDYGATMVAVGPDPASLLARVGGHERPVASLLAALDHVGGYREDPLRKKSALLAVILRQRPERWLPVIAGDEVPPIVDYHVQRTVLRTGMVRVLDEDLRRRLVDRRFLTADEARRIRSAAFEVVEHLVEASGRDVGAVDWFLFQMRHRCPETSVPDCSACPADPACAHAVELFQPVIRTTAY